MKGISGQSPLKAAPKLQFLARLTRASARLVTLSALMDNLNPVFLIIVGVAIILSCLSTIVLAIVGTVILWVLKGLLTTEVRKDLLPSIAGTLRNVEKMSVDAAATTHNVTGAVNRISNLVGAASTRLESPIIRMVGIASGVLAAGRAVRGGKKTVIVEKKRKGLF